MSQAVDYSFERPNPADLAAAGYVGALRYLAPLPNSKVITGDELASLHANGLAVGFVWESGNQRAAASGYAGGQQDAQRAIAMLQALGAPAGTGLFYVLEDPNTIPKSQWPSALAYAQGVLDVGGPFRQGGYGSQALLEEANRRGLIALGWQVGGWSAGPSPMCQLLQRSDAAAHPPAGCDVNDILQADWGQWPAQGDDMPSLDEIQQLLEKELTAVELRISTRITDSEARQDQALPPLIGATVAATVKASAGGNVDPDAIAAAVVRDIGSLLSK